MTGFGVTERTWDPQRQRVALELRSVNARFLELKIRQPFGVAVEHRLRKRLEAALGRGRVELSIRVEAALDDSGMGALASIGVAPEQLEGAMVAVRELSRAAEDAGVTLRDPTGLELLRFVQSSAGGGARTRTALEIPDFLDQLVDEGVTALVSMRAREGEALARVLGELYDELERQVASISASLEGEGERLLGVLEQRAQTLLERTTQAGVERDRLEQVLAILLLRGDVSEELARIASHLSQARSVLGAEAAAGQGKTLDFLCQELLREVTTIGSKISSHTGSATVIEAKRTIERIREQVQNVE